jgi:hypothetical protein
METLKLDLAPICLPVLSCLPSPSLACPLCPSATTKGGLSLPMGGLSLPKEGLSLPMGGLSLSSLSLPPLARTLEFATPPPPSLVWTTLRSKFYTVFDLDKRRIGFALANQPHEHPPAYMHATPDAHGKPLPAAVPEASLASAALGGGHAGARRSHAGDGRRRTQPKRRRRDAQLRALFPTEL